MQSDHANGCGSRRASAKCPGRRRRARSGRGEKMDTNRLIEVEDLRIHFPLEDRTVKAVDGVSWHLDKGETLAEVGESGSGKSVTAMGLMRLTDNAGGRIPSCSIYFIQPHRQLTGRVTQDRKRKGQGNR